MEEQHAAGLRETRQSRATRRGARYTCEFDPTQGRQLRGGGKVCLRSKPCSCWPSPSWAGQGREGRSKGMLDRASRVAQGGMSDDVLGTLSLHSHSTLHSASRGHSSRRYSKPSLHLGQSSPATLLMCHDEPRSGCASR